MGSGHQTAALGIESVENEAMADYCDRDGVDNFTSYSKFQVRFYKFIFN